jgi:superfamily I DNA/RNA helicase
MILLPEKYNEIKLTKDEKLLINMIKNKFDDSVISLLKINPIGKYSMNAFVFEEGVCLMESLEVDNIALVLVLFQTLETAYKDRVKKIYDKLLMHRVFNDIENNSLKLLFTYKYYIPKLKREDIDTQLLSDKIKEFIEKHCIFKDQIRKLTKEPEELKRAFLSNYEYPISEDSIKLKNEALDVLIHMLAPEYTIPRYDKSNLSKFNNKIIKKAEKEYFVSEGELSVQVLRLDSEQINIINNIKAGHQLILACAGSGKSVLLISKCFKIASIHTDKEFLITCYYRNLNDMYRWRINVAGFRNRNVSCYTFHKLCRELLNEANIYYNGNDFDSMFEIARKALKEGKIKRRFYGIFIDEVQVFKREWYEFCYDLLEKHEEDDYFFIICGDKSQNINKNIKQGKAPWQGNERLPKYRGKSLRLEKNYRNTIEVNSYINRFTEIAKEYATKFNMVLKEDQESLLRGQAVRNGENPQIIYSNRSKEAEEVVKAILHLNKEKKVPLSEIAVLMFNKKYKVEKYHIYTRIKSKLDYNYIHYCELVPTESMYRTTYGDREGVTLCTIESALGLDFEAVIICGLKPMGSHYMTKKEHVFNHNNEQLEECKEDYIKNINTLYTGCTRARDHLYIILPENEKQSIYSKMLKEAINE